MLIQKCYQKTLITELSWERNFDNVELNLKSDNTFLRERSENKSYGKCQFCYKKQILIVHYYYCCVLQSEQVRVIITGRLKNVKPKNFSAIA